MRDEPPSAGQPARRGAGGTGAGVASEGPRAARGGAEAAGAQRGMAALGQGGDREGYGALGPPTEVLEEGVEREEQRGSSRDAPEADGGGSRQGARGGGGLEVEA